MYNIYTLYAVLCPAPRYVICQSFRPESERVASYLYNINTALCDLRGSDRDVLQVGGA